MTCKAAITPKRPAALRHSAGVSDARIRIQREPGVVAAAVAAIQVLPLLHGDRPSGLFVSEGSRATLAIARYVQ